MYKSILVPTDGSTLSAKAVHQALALAKSTGARITAVHVMPPLSDLPVPELAEPYDASVNEGGVVAISHSPHEAIIRQAGASSCDLIMMASHGRKGVQAIVLGSETTKVLVHSKIPVLVVR